MNKYDWNPEMYLKFDKERILPSIDLVSRIDYEYPIKIIDIGCGPGNSTQVLHNRWPNANIVGADNSPAMINKAKQDYPHQQWLLFDAGKDHLEEQFDIVFSNATIQWISGHDELIAQFYKLLNDDGILAVQLPLFFDMPVSKAFSEVAGLSKWKNATNGVTDLWTINNPSFYYDHLSKYFKRVEIWTSDYYHVMDSHAAIIEMMRSTGMRPYLERIAKEEHKEFETLVLGRIKQYYPSQADGKVLYPFKRLFFVAKK